MPETVTRTLRATDSPSKLLINLIEDLRNGVMAILQGAPTATDTGLTKSRTLLAADAAVNLKASAGNLFAINIANGHSAAIYVKFYDHAAPTSATTPILTIIVPATSPYTLRGADLPLSFATALSVRCVTEHADNGTTAPATLPIIEVETK